MILPGLSVKAYQLYMGLTFTPLALFRMDPKGVEHLRKQTHEAYSDPPEMLYPAIEDITTGIAELARLGFIKLVGDSFYLTRQGIDLYETDPQMGPLLPKTFWGLEVIDLWDGDFAPGIDNPADPDHKYHQMIHLRGKETSEALPQILESLGWTELSRQDQIESPELFAAFGIGPDDHHYVR